MKIRTLIRILLSALLLLLLSACVAGVGNRLPAEGARTTVSRDLIDLQRALDAGAITEHEFEQQKTRITAPSGGR